MPDVVGCVVVGAGVVGIAVARELALAGIETVIVEAEKRIGSQTSSRNSEVIHAGIYYPPYSLKARLCVEGKAMLYRYCEEHKVAFRRCEKLIVATSPQQKHKLNEIRDKAAGNGVNDLQYMHREQVGELEPAIECIAALRSPSTGIIDSHGFMLSLQGEFEDAGGALALGSPVLGGKCTNKGVVLSVGGRQPTEICARYLINCAGLHAQKVASRLEGLPKELVPPLFYAKGNYYWLASSAPFRHLIYPVPESGGLGVHLTLDLAGGARFGPDVQWIDDMSYEVDPNRSAAFYSEIRKYWPDLPDDSLVPAYAGIRPKLQPQGKPASDFMIQGPQVHGIPGLVNLYGIESPGLTASLAIARTVKNTLLAN